MKPVYSNAMNLAHNKTKSEVTLTFSHNYTEHNFSMTGGTLTDVSAPVVEEVASIVMNRESVVALTQMLSKMLSDWEK